MSGMTLEDGQFLEKRRKTLNVVRLMGWGSIVFSLAMALVLWTKYDVLQKSLQQGMSRAHVSARKLQTTTPLEAKLLEELLEQDRLLVQLLGIVVLSVAMLTLGTMFYHGVTSVISASERSRFLQIIDRLGAQDRVHPR